MNHKLFCKQGKINDPVRGECDVGVYRTIGTHYKNYKIFFTEGVRMVRYNFSKAKITHHERFLRYFYIFQVRSYYLM